MPDPIHQPKLDAHASGNAGGTVLSSQPDGLLVFGNGRAERIVCHNPGDFRAGDIVEFDQEAGDVRALWRHPTGEWPPPHSDAFGWLQDARWEQLRQRAGVMRQTRRFFEDAGFLEVETPALVVSAGTELHLDAVEARCEGQRGYLITSPEYHMKRLLAAGGPPIFQISKVWRDHERGAQHRPEFTMLEWYRPFATYDSLMDDCEAWIRGLVGADSLTYQGKNIDLRGPWRRITFRDALRERGGVSDPDALTPQAQEAVLMDRVEPTLGHDQPEFLTEYPMSMASLARPKPEDPTVAERVELFIGGLELGNGFSELTDAKEQRARCNQDNADRAALGKQPYPLDERFLAALSHGMPPSAGIAIGLDRVVMLLTDEDDISKVTAFGTELDILSTEGR